MQATPYPKFFKNSSKNYTGALEDLNNDDNDDNNNNNNNNSSSSRNNFNNNNNKYEATRYKPQLTNNF